jgi:hypothetical protein
LGAVRFIRRLGENRQTENYVETGKNLFKSHVWPCPSAGNTESLGNRFPADKVRKLWPSKRFPSHQQFSMSEMAWFQQLRFQRLRFNFRFARHPFAGGREPPRAFPCSGCWTIVAGPRRRIHSPRAERMKVKPPSPPSAQSVQTKKKPPGDLAISP